MQIFSGSANRELAQKVAGELDLKLGEVEISRFANDEARVLIQETKVGREVVVIQPGKNLSYVHL